MAASRTTFESTVAEDEQSLDEVGAFLAENDEEAFALFDKWRTFMGDKMAATFLESPPKIEMLLERIFVPAGRQSGLQDLLKQKIEGMGT